MVGGVNIVITIGITLKIITDWLKLPVISIIIFRVVPIVITILTPLTILYISNTKTL